MEFQLASKQSARCVSCSHAEQPTVRYCSLAFFFGEEWTAFSNESDRQDCIYSAVSLEPTCFGEQFFVDGVKLARVKLEIWTQQSTR